MSQIQNNIWAAPRLSMRWWPVFRRNFLVWQKLAIPSLVGNIAEPLMWLVAWPVLLGVGITFSCMALIFNALAKGSDFFTYYFTLFLTPMMFLSGIFFPRDQLPPIVRAIADWLPLSAAVDLVRPLFLDRWPEHALRHGLVLLVFSAVSFWIALALTRKRFRS